MIMTPEKESNFGYPIRLNLAPQFVFGLGAREDTWMSRMWSAYATSKPYSQPTFFFNDSCYPLPPITEVAEVLFLLLSHANFPASVNT